MGVKTKLSLSKLNKLQKDFYFTSLKESISGISDTTYFATSNTNETYVLKLYEQSTIQEVKQEIKLLERIKELRVTKVITSFLYDNKPLIVFSYIPGESPTLINKEKLQSLACFLANMHEYSYNIPKNHIESPLGSLIKELKTFEDAPLTLVKEFTQRYELLKDIDLDLHACIIHGDLFPDNAKFKHNRLMGVYDFSQSSIASRYIDIGIVLNSWCFVNGKFSHGLAKAFWNSYKEHSQKNIKYDDLKTYILYTALFFALNRYLKIYKYEIYEKTILYDEFLDKFDEIKQHFVVS